MIANAIAAGTYSKRRATMAETEERSDDDNRRFDYYDNGPVTPHDKLSPAVLRGIARIKAIQEKALKESAARQDNPK
jgi:hypothetical protein